jgi:DNA replication protein DnaC
MTGDYLTRTRREIAGTTQIVGPGGMGKTTVAVAIAHAMLTDDRCRMQRMHRCLLQRLAHLIKNATSKTATITSPYATR